MWVLGLLASIALIALALVDGFETIINPRRVTRRYRLVRLYYRGTWAFCRLVALRFKTSKRREGFVSVFGPLSLLGLFVTWLVALIVGFALLHWSIGTPLLAREHPIGFEAYLYLSGTTFFTLGYGDITPLGAIGRALGVVESGLGFGFLAVIISYMPVLYQAFSEREVTISLLDARAGSPPTASEFLLRLARSGRMASADGFLAEWERWSAVLLGNHLSFPVLSYYRSQHDNQSWLAALTTILDTSAILIVGSKECDPYQAQLTFAAARHAAVDLALVLKIPPQSPEPDRLPATQLQQLWALLQEAGVSLNDEALAGPKLAELRALYEPFVNALAERLLFALPPVVAIGPAVDNWQKSAWMKRPPGIGDLPPGPNDHFG